jgi:hypothetical protein
MIPAEQPERPFEEGEAIRYLMDGCGFPEGEARLILGEGTFDEQAARFEMFQEVVAQCEILGGPEGVRLFFHGYPESAPHEAGFALDDFGCFYDMATGEPIEVEDVFQIAKSTLQRWEEDPAGTRDSLLDKYGPGWGERMKAREAASPAALLKPDSQVDGRKLRELAERQGAEIQMVSGFLRFSIEHGDTEPGQG